MTEFPMRFITNNRFYEINVYQDMFDDWVVVCDYGSRHTRASHRKIIAADDQQAGLNLVDRIVKLRIRHGYSPVSLKV